MAIIVNERETMIHPWSFPFKRVGWAPAVVQRCVTRQKPGVLVQHISFQTLDP